MTDDVNMFGTTWWVWQHRDSRFSRRLTVQETNGQRRLGIEFSAPSSLCGLSLHAGGEQSIVVGLSLPPASLYLSLETPALRELAQYLVALWPDPAAPTYSRGRSLSIAMHDNALWWHLWTDSDCWSRARPKWRNGSWHPLGFHQVQGEAEVVEQRELVIPMPERSYRAVGKLERIRVGFSRLPRVFDRTFTRAQIEMHPGEHVPHPGKGENSWDCDEDGIFSMSCQARTLEEAVGIVVADSLRTRMRRGGPNWRPQERPAEASA